MKRRQFLASAAASLLAARSAQAHSVEPSPPVEEDGQWTLPPFMLEDVNGTVVDDSALRGRFSLVFFGYTHCPDICPTTLFTIANVLKELGPAGDRILPLFVSLDPARDTRKLLSDYVATFDPRIVALRGPKPYVDAAAKAFNVKYEIVTPDPAQPDNYSIDHTASIAFIGPEGQMITRFANGMPAAAIAAEIAKVLAEAPNSAAQ